MAYSHSCCKKDRGILSLTWSGFFRASLATGYVPAIWCQVKAVFIPEPGTHSYSGPRDFAPISLRPFLLTTTNRLVDRFLRDKAIKKKVPVGTTVSKGTE